MSSSFILAVFGVAATYVFLRALAFFTYDSREPEAVVGTIPFISPLIGMLTEKGGYYVRMRDKLRLPIYTLRVPGPPIYVVNSLALLQRLDRHILTLAFCPVEARACENVMGVSKKGMESVKSDNMLEEDGYLRSFGRFTAAGAAPGPGLNDLNRSVVNHFAATFDRLASSKGPTVIHLFDFIRHKIFAATMNATYGPQNPFKDPKLEQAWWDFEPSIMAMLLGALPNLFAKKALKARDLMVSALDKYLQQGGYTSGSRFVQLRQQHNAIYGLDLSDTAHTEIGQVAAGVVNTVPSAFWMVWSVVSNPVILKECHEELLSLVHTDADGNKSIDMAQVRARCPILLSTWQEVLRYHGISIAVRLVQEDTLVDDHYLLKKGGVVMAPNSVIHSDTSIYGPTAGQFDHMRFVKTVGRKRPSAAGFRGFGGGHVLCPGRHFASTEVMALAALIILRFDVQPMSGKWAQPPKDMVMDRACPLPKIDPQLRLTRKDEEKWNIIFSDSNQGVNIVAEDIDEESQVGE